MATEVARYLGTPGKKGGTAGDRARPFQGAGFLLDPELLSV